MTLERETEIVKEIIKIEEDFVEKEVSEEEKKNQKKAIESSIDSLAKQLKIINNAIPELIKGVSFYTQTDVNKKNNSKAINISYNDDKKNEVSLGINKKERDMFLESLSSYTASKKRYTKKSEEDNSVMHFTAYIGAANKLFLNMTSKIIAGGGYSNIRTDLIKITSPLILNSYLSIMFFSCLLAFLFGIVISAVMFILKANIILAILTPFLLLCLTFFLFYAYPSSKRKSLEKEINQELPFLIIYMSAIATSGIEPSKIFQIIASSEDYPFTKREIKKLTNYLNFYGYDLVSALKIVAKNCPSERMAQLFDGLSTTITSGGELTAFLNKHSDSLMFDYKLEREKYTRTAETFMNIYISVVIAAPMIMMMIFILMSLGGLSQGFLSPATIGLVTILTISLLNLGFLIFLNFKQPKF
jgi:Flp pilus assembly protein TadB